MLSRLLPRSPGVPSGAGKFIRTEAVLRGEDDAPDPP